MRSRQASTISRDDVWRRPEGVRDRQAIGTGGRRPGSKSVRSRSDSVSGAGELKLRGVHRSAVAALCLRHSPANSFMKLSCDARYGAAVDRLWRAGAVRRRLRPARVQERELTFRPSRDAAYWFGGMPDGVRESLSARGQRARCTEDQCLVVSRRRRRRPAVLYLHGARWNLTGQLRRIEQLHRFGFSVFAIDYRGFGKSDGDLPVRGDRVRRRAGRLAVARGKAAGGKRAASSTVTRSAAPLHRSRGAAR